MSDPNWFGLGEQQEVSQHRLRVAEDALDQARSYAEKSKTHLWVVTLAHRATDQLLDGFDGHGGSPILDADTLLTAPAIGCFVCEEPYTKQLRRRRCPGEPKGAR